MGWSIGSACAIIAMALLLQFVVVNPGVTAQAAGSPAPVSARAGTASREAGSHQPVLYKMLGVNDKIDGKPSTPENGKSEYDDNVFRADFVLRVTHGDVKPAAGGEGVGQLAGQPGESGLQLYMVTSSNNTSYDRGPHGSYDPTMAKLNPNEQLTQIPYLITNTGTDDASTAQAGADDWAANTQDCFTIHSVTTSGSYDYLTISIETSIKYSQPYDSTEPGGEMFSMYLYAAATFRTLGGSISFASLQSQTNGILSGNLMGDNLVAMYSDDCPGTQLNACDGPMAYYGGKGKTKTFLRNGGRTNWGLTTDYGLTDEEDTKEVDVPAGIAPKKSFFVDFYVPSYRKDSPTHKCSEVKTFRYEWLGLKDGKDWVPVTSITPDAELSNMAPQNDGSQAGNLSAFNSVKPASTTSTDLRKPATLIASTASDDPNTTSAQHLDGSIDFKKAKQQQPGLDGYFKLIAWPESTNPRDIDSDPFAGCTSALQTSDPKGGNGYYYNPIHYLTGGVRQGTKQSDAVDLIERGWTVGSVFYDFDAGVPQAPTIDNPADGSKITVGSVDSIGFSGKGTEGDVVNLYAEDPSHPFKPSDPNDPDSTGTLVGSATVKDGKWSVAVPSVGLAPGQHRYHAVLVHSSGGSTMQSPFSNTKTIQFVRPADSMPTIAKVQVPHTKNGVLPANSKVVVTGTAQTANSGSGLFVYAIPAKDAGSSPAVGSQVCKITDLSTTSSPWECDIPTDFFTKSTVTKNVNYVVKADIVNADGIHSTMASSAVTIDMYPPLITTAKQAADGLDGTVVCDINGTQGCDQAGKSITGTSVAVTWPDGSTSSGTADVHGAWHVARPKDMKQSGQVSIRATDKATNESKAYPMSFTFVSLPSISSLPFTGEGLRKAIIWSVVAAVLVAGLVTALIGARKLKKREIAR